MGFCVTYGSDEITCDFAFGCGRTMILHQCLHLFLDALVPLGDVDMQRVVAAGLAVGPFTPLLESRDEADARLRNHVVNWICTNTNTWKVKHTDWNLLWCFYLLLCCYVWNKLRPIVVHTSRPNMFQLCLKWPLVIDLWELPDTWLLSLYKPEPSSKYKPSYAPSAHGFHHTKTSAIWAQDGIVEDVTFQTRMSECNGSHLLMCGPSARSGKNVGSH